MDSVLWYVIPLAVAVALSVMPILAAVLILLAPNPVPVSVRYLIGWAFGVMLLVIVFALGAAVLPRSGKEVTPPWVHGAELVLGVLLAGYAVWALRRTKPPSQEQPAWMRAVARLSPRQALYFGMAMNVRPKNLTLAIAAGIAIGSSAMDPIYSVLTVVIFVVIAISTVGGLVLAYAVGDKRVRPALVHFSNWLQGNTALVLNVSLLLIAAFLIGLGVYNVFIIG